MGSSHELQNRRKRRNSDCISNYVDRVRICDTKSIDSESIYSKANSQKSGWRQKSLSNIDLSLSSKDFQPGAGAFRYRDFETHDDLCIKNIKNSKNIEIQRDYEDICNVNPKAQGAKRDIIQEHNKVNLEKPETCSLRRSKSLAVIREETFNELAITGAKTRRSQLIPRAKLIDRNFFKDRLSFPLEESFSTSLDTAIDSDCKKSNSNYYSWQCDRSDLGSIDSSIFKHSLHQTSLEKSNSIRTDSTKVISRAEIHNEDKKDIEVKSQKDASINVNEDTESGITIIEIKDRRPAGTSVISYDSIYLSSESDRQTVLGDFNDDSIDAKIRDFEEIIKELNAGDNEKADSIIDNLYSQVGKTKESSEVKINPSKHTDYGGKNTLERLTILTGLNGKVEKQEKITKSQNNRDFQYSSLPDSISELLRDCELIDAKLRDDASVKLLEPYPDYDSLPNEPSNEESSLNKIASVEEENPKGAPSIELVQLPTKEIIDDTNAPVKSNTTKIYLSDIGVEFDYENSIASFESDRDFESPSQEQQPPSTFNLVTISGRKVIVDEFAAKVEQKEKVELQPLAINQGGGGDVVGEKVNGSDKRKVHRDKEEKIKLSECKQEQPVDSADKKISLKTSNDLVTTAAAIQSDSNCAPLRLLRRNCLSFNMPRPQLLSIIDSKNSVPKRDQKKVAGDGKLDEMEVSSEYEEKRQPLNQTEREFLHKVDSVRSYWSKMVNDESNLKKMSKNFLSTKSSSDIPEALKNEDFQSFFPTVEIVELNGETQAALVTSRKLNDVEFDHVRYKVMKSDMFQKNLLVGNRKETQFDGLMQYLQDYSFQELLANNNVVIIEPVRTKIEKVAEKPREATAATCKITNGALNRNGSKNLKKNFFYHPIRVNKELYEEELPVPDTVRNVRKLFEESLRLGTSSKVDDKPAGRKTIRYLTIDTSFDNNNLGVSKWDSISLSSGVSSAADLNSPCECQDNSNRNENLDNDEDNDNDDDGEFKSHFVSADVLEKIRECGSSITYYGGQTTADEKKMNSDAMTKAIMREINSQKCSCPSRKTSRQSEKFVRKISNDYSGLKFKLVKSNSCSSRLELTGTGMERSNSNAMEEMRNIIHNQIESSSDDNEHKKDLCEHEETVKDMVSRLESKSFAGAPTKPRIIESRCIEKASKDSSPKVTINHQSFGEKVKSACDVVTVNNHSNSGSNVPQDEAALKPVRNKNVDLAMASMVTKKTKTFAGDTENLAPSEPPHMKKWGNICKMESVEMVKHQDKLNIKNEQQLKSAQKSPGGDEKPIKMVNWSTVGTVVGKEYIANDRSLIQTKIYDEMEFEEFEVMGEHYDSLNSK